MGRGRGGAAVGQGWHALDGLSGRANCARRVPQRLQGALQAGARTFIVETACILLLGRLLAAAEGAYGADEERGRARTVAGALLDCAEHR